MKAKTIRTSERRTFTSCRQKWYWSYVDRLRPRVAAPALRFGTLIHEALEARYPVGAKRGPHPAEAFEDLYQKELEDAFEYGFRDDDGAWMKAGDLGVAMMNEFVREYGEDERWEVVSSEQLFRVRMTPQVTYAGKLDGIWRDRDTGHILLKEWKTAAQFWFGHLPLDEQAGSYWAIAPPWLRKKGILKKGEKLQGILYTFLRKAMPDDRPKNEDGLSLNKNGTVSKRQPAPLFHREMAYRDTFDRNMVRARIIAQAEEMAMCRDGALAVYKVPDQRNCGGCPFLDACELHETGADYQPLLRAGFERYNPYSEHEVREEGMDKVKGS